MKCPSCGIELEEVSVLSTCVQLGTVDESGLIIEYSSVEEIYDTEEINCSECFEDVTLIIKES